MIRRPPRSTLFPTRRSSDLGAGRPRPRARTRGALPPCLAAGDRVHLGRDRVGQLCGEGARVRAWRSEEHTSELQSLTNLVCRLLREKKKKTETEHDAYQKRY